MRGLAIYSLGGGFKYFLCSPLLGEMIQFDEHIFQSTWNERRIFFRPFEICLEDPKGAQKVW